MNTRLLKILVSAYAGILLCPTTYGQSVNNPTRDEFAELKSRVEKLEAAFASLHIEIEDAESLAESSSLLSSNSDSDSSLLDRVISVIQKREEVTNFPWMNPQLWSSLKPEMSKDDVIAILGEPDLIEPSLYKRVDTVFTYKGRQSSTGKRVQGIIRFYRDQLIEIESPEF